MSAKPLTTKQQLFVQHYLACHNAAEAARRAGYSERSAYSIGSENLRKPEIQQAISEAVRNIMPPSEVVARLADQARGSMGDFLRIDEEEMLVDMRIVPLTQEDQTNLILGGHTALQSLIDNREEEERIVKLQTVTIKRAVARLDLLKAADKLHLIKKYSEKEGQVSIELYDAHAALIDIGRMHGLFIDKVAPTDPTGTKPYDDAEAIEAALLRKLTSPNARAGAADVSEESDEE